MGNGGVPKSKVEHYVKLGEELKKEIKETLKNDGVIIMPTFPISAIYHNQSAFVMMYATYTLLGNVMGLPSMSVPMGLNKDGLPIGVQVTKILTVLLQNFKYVQQKKSRIH